MRLRNHWGVLSETYYTMDKSASLSSSRRVLQPSYRGQGGSHTSIQFLVLFGAHVVF